MRRILFVGSALFLVTSTALVSSKAAELKQGEWRVWFGGIQKTENVKVTIKADGTSYSVQGTPANLGIIFKAQSGKFQPAQKFVDNKQSHFILEEPVVVTVRRSGKEIKQVKADQVEIQYRKTE